MYLQYQPCQGLGNQIMEFHIMIQIAKALNRTLVVPTPVEHANDEPSKSTAISTWDLGALKDVSYITEDQYEGEIDLAFRMIPLYLLANVRMNNIEEYYKLCPGSKKTINEPRVKHGVKTWKTCLVKTSFTLDGICRVLNSNERTIFVSYCYDLCIPWTWPITPEWNISIRLNPMYKTLAQELMKEMNNTCSCHVRRGDFVTFLQITNSPITLPAWQIFEGQVLESGINNLFVVSDDSELCSKGIKVNYPKFFDHALQYALMDMAICLSTTKFFGTKTSTFSQYIHHIRCQDNKHSVLL